MTVNLKQENDNLIIELEGRLDTVTSQELNEKLPKEKRAKLNIVFDFAKLEYISSAGLRLLILFKKEAQADDKKLTIKNCNEVVKEVFSVTGFSKILNIE